MNEKRLRLDFILAIGALLISSIAALASVYQSRVVAQQFSATVWPYVSFDATRSPALLELNMRNDGLGPAIVRSAVVSWNGKPQASLESLFATLAAHDPSAIIAIRAAQRAGATERLTTSTPTRGMVIPANAAHTIVRLEGAVLKQRFGRNFDRFDVSLCYCSLTGTCWTQRFKDRAGEPSSVRSCS